MEVSNEVHNIDLLLSELDKDRVFIPGSILKVKMMDVAKGSTYMSNWHIIALDKLQRDKFVIAERTDSEIKYNISYEGVIFLNKGGYTKQLQREKREALWKKVEDFPKRFWFIGLFLASIGFNIKDALKYFSRNNIQTAKTKPLIKYQQQDTSKTHQKNP